MAAAVATRMVFAPLDGTNELWDVATEVDKYTALNKNGKAGVALGNSGGHTFSKTVGPYTFGGPNGAAGYAALEVGVFTTGTYEFSDVTGVTTGSKAGDLVYIDSTGALTTTATSNTLFGALNFPKGYVKAAKLAPVKIGA